MNRLPLLLVALLLPVVTGQAVGLKRVCHNEDGSLDITFGNHGKVVTNVSNGGSVAEGVVTLPCGRIVTVGFTNPFQLQSDFVLVGYDSNGFVDTHFGNNGVVTTDFGTILPGAVVPSSKDQVSAVALQENCNGCEALCSDYCNDSCNNSCRIVVVGFSNVLGTNAFAVARYNGDGMLDTSFGEDKTGLVVIPVGIVNDEAFAVAIQKDNKIVIVGYTEREDGLAFDFGVVRLNCDGTLDTAFGCDGTGIVTIRFGGDFNTPRAVKIQKDGKIVVAGFSDVDGSQDFALARLTPEGILDITFGKNHNGKVLTDFSNDNTSNDRINALVLVEECGSCCDSDMVRIVAVGTSDVGGLPKFALAGYTEHGCLDKNFGSNGLVITSFSGSTFSLANAAALERNCEREYKIIAAGLVQFPKSSVGLQSDFALARYLLDGSLDPHFGVAGRVTTDFLNQSSDIAFAVTLQENGNIIAAGSTTATTMGLLQFALARYNVCNTCCVQYGLACSSCK